jgi:protein-disulfide isomerase
LALVALIFFLAGYFTNSLFPLTPSSAATTRQDEGDTAPAAREAVPAAGLEGRSDGQSAANAVDSQPERFDVDDGEAPYQGSEDALVTIVEFSDYQCPYCKRFRDETMDQLLAKYEGQVRFVYRDFPLSSIHPEALKAAEAARCAHEQDQFWAMHDQLFASQPEWSRAPDTGAIFKGYAAELNIDAAKFAGCLDSGRYNESISQDFQAGVQYGVQGTPTFFVNGRKLVGAQPLSAFEAIINEELAAAN